MKPRFFPGRNIAVKVPSHEFEDMVFFYGTLLGLERLTANCGEDSAVFEFGGKSLWVDRTPGLSQAELWLEIETANPEDATQYLAANGCVFRNDIESLPDTVNGFWLNSPSNIIHLVVAED